MSATSLMACTRSRRSACEAADTNRSYLYLTNVNNRQSLPIRAQRGGEGRGGEGRRGEEGRGGFSIRIEREDDRIHR